MNKKICILFILFITLGILSSSIFAEETIPTAIHVHSDISSGGRPIAEIAALAKKQNVEAVIFTDLYDERYEYGYWILKKKIERESIAKIGIDRYLEKIKNAGEQNPEVILIDGTAVTPFYYWTGNLWPGPLVMKNRAKDLLVLGLGEKEKYDALPVIQKGNSGFTPYQGDLFYKPYQKFIDETSKLGGLVFWSHPLATENLQFNNVFLGLDIVIHTAPYPEALLETKNYTGFGVFSTELVYINTTPESTIWYDGMWDKALRQHCRGQRKPIWAIGEVDYNGLQKGITRLDSILNMVWAPEKSREAILKSLSDGKVYLVIPSSHERRVMIDEYAVFDRTSGNKATSGEELQATGVPVVRLNAKFSNDSEGTMEIILLRNGSLLEQWTKTLPFTLDYEDWNNTNPGKSYYRIVAYSEQTPDKLLTNPIFVQRDS